MISVIHPLLSYVVSAIFTGNPRLRLASFVGGIVPDLDGIALLFDKELYYKYHREILHPPLSGLALSILLFYLYERKSPLERRGTAAFFMLGFVVHAVSDVLTTNWPINFLAPFGTLYVSISPALPDSVIYGTIAPALTILTLVLFAALALTKNQATTHPPE